jgi:hypothetical protein
MSCLPCGRDLHEECQQIPEGKKCCCTQNITMPQPREGNNYKSDDEIGVSAGRKRAAVAHSINPDRSCEWRWKKNCGGGVHPIIGCLTGMQEHRHHGPVKNTARNEVSNVHLICTSCHNRWHTLNDPDYDEASNELLPHNPTPATLKECTDNEIKWKSSKVKK